MCSTSSPNDILLVGSIFSLLRTPLEPLGTLYEVPLPFSPATCPSLTLDAFPKIRAAVTTSVGGFPKPLFELLPALEIISNFGVGVDSIDIAEATKRGIVVTNTPGVLTDDVADLAIGLMIATARRMCTADQYVRRGEWPGSKSLQLTTKVTGKRVGILGLGRIGLATAQRASAFLCRIAYCNRTQRTDVPDTYQYYSTPVDLAAASDVLIVACPLTQETTKLVDRAVLDALGPMGIIVNIARGAVVDEVELVRALQEGRIAGAGLDVFANEPHVPEGLIGMENVVLLPHIGTDTVETSEDMAALLVKNVQAKLNGQPALTPVP